MRSRLTIIWLIVGANLWSLAGQSGRAVNWSTHNGRQGEGIYALPLEALDGLSKLRLWKSKKQALSPETITEIRYGEDLVLRTVVEGADSVRLQLLVAGEYQLYRSIVPAKQASFWLDTPEGLEVLPKRKAGQQLYRLGSNTKPAKVAYKTADLMRTVKRLNKGLPSGWHEIYTPFEMSRWQLLMGFQGNISGAVSALQTTEELTEIGRPYLGLARRLSNKLPHFWGVANISWYRYSGDNRFLFHNRRPFTRSLRFDDWQFGLRLLGEVSPRTAASPYFITGIDFLVPANLRLEQLKTDTSGPLNGLPLVVVQNARPILTVGQSLGWGVRVQAGSFWSIHFQFLVRNQVYRVDFGKQDNVSEVAEQGVQSWQKTNDRVLRLHIQFAIR